VTTFRTLLQSSLDKLTLHRRGKVRDVYELDDHLLIVATDRISAFDYVLPTAIPEKGAVLTQLSAFWFEMTRDIVGNHLIAIRPEEFPPPAREYSDVLDGRTMLVRRTKPIPLECVVRGHLAGSGWKEYRESGSVCGVKLPTGLRESDKLPEPIFTPATKEETGHDINISEEEAGRLIGKDLVAELRDISIEVYSRGAAHAESRGIIVADTKFEFGHDADGKLLMIDEVLTPDSSRFWPSDLYKPGAAQPSFDKQYVRDYLEDIRWDKRPPAPELPEVVVARTHEKYVEAFRRLTGRELAHHRTGA
jgi:phosphoribosylaminoimidazole-succinocarboxamide synthase